MAAGSLKRINKFALGEARGHKKFFIIVNLILGMGALLYTFMSSIYSDSRSLNWEPSILGLFLLIVGGGIGLMGAASIFRDMNSVQLGDVQLSLPMTANERFFSKLLALGYIHIFPLIAWLGSSSLINWLRIMASSGGSERDDLYILPIFLMILAGALFVDCVTVLCSVCCGALAESVYFSMISICCLSIAPALIRYTIAETCAGQNGDPGLGFSVWTLSFVVNVGVMDETIGVLNCVLMLNCVVSLAVMALTSLLYRKRDARTIGTPIANRVFFECVMFLGLATVYGMFFFNTEAYIGMIIVGVIYMVIHIISSRGKISVAKFGGWFAKFAVSTTAYVLLCWAAYTTNGFGIVYHLPSADLAESNIQITLTCTEDGRTVDKRFTSHVKGNGQSELTDEQIRRAARVYQKALAGRPKSAVDFFARLNGNVWDDDYSGKFSRLDISYGKMSGSFFVDDFSQSEYLTLEEMDKISQELTELGFLEVEVDGRDYDYYPENVDWEY